MSHSRYGRYHRQCKIIPGEPSLRSLCLTSKALCAVVQPMLLAEINLGTPLVSRKKCKAQLRSLATGNCLASEYARILIIDYVGLFGNDPTQVISPMEMTVLRYLKHALLSFKFLKRVECVFSL